MITTEVTPKCMSMNEVRKKAKALGISPGKMKKAELIHSIQIAEGSTPCFGTSGGQCVSFDCCFMQDCLKISLTECRQAEGHLKQQSVELTEANKQLENQITKREQAENELQEYRDRLDRYLWEQTVELTAANIQDQIAGHKRVQNELQEYRDQLEQHLKEQTDELTAINEQLQSEIAKREQAEESLALLQTKLDNTNFIIRKYLEFRKIRPKALEPSTFGLRCVAEFCGRIFGSVASVFSQ